MKPALARLEALEKRKLSHHYIPGTAEFDAAIHAFFFRVKARCCTTCPQVEDFMDDEAAPCLTSCPAWDACEADEAELLDQEDILMRILYERIMGQK